MLQRILLVDDSEGEALLVTQMLRNAGLTEPVLWLSSAERAVNYLLGKAAYADRESYPLPDLILLDLAMPGIDGYQFLQWLRQEPELSRTMVIVLTGEMDPKRIQLAYQLGANSFLAKSAGLDEFRNFVDFLGTLSRVASAFSPEAPVPSAGFRPVEEQHQPEAGKNAA